jgi:hypothetical protein
MAKVIRTHIHVTEIKFITLTLFIVLSIGVFNEVDGFIMSAYIEITMFWAT